MSLIYKISQLYICFLNKKSLKKGFFVTVKQTSPHEASCYASLKRARAKASYTVEACVVIPMMITAMVFMLFFMKIMEVQSGIQRSIDLASRTVATCCDTEDEPDTMLGEAKASAYLLIGNNGVPTRYISGGILGIDFSESTANDNYINLRANYNIKFPVGLMGHFRFHMTNQSKNRKWIGFDPDENAWDGQYVYITKSGVAYHTTTDCPYLRPSTKPVNLKDVGDKRNESEHKYYPCESCDAARLKSGTVYIADYGEAYHSTLSCKALKRSIHKVLLENVKDTHRPCVKCGG